MSNMSYCRYRNTLEDLQDCQNYMEDTEELDWEEARARKWLIKMCVAIAEDYGHEIHKEIIVNNMN